MYKYLEHEADMGVYAQAESWLEVFSEGARAVFSLMFRIESRPADAPTDVKTLAGKKAMAGKQQKAPARGWSASGGESRIIKIEVSADSIEGLFVEWINELLAQKDINSLVFREFNVEKINKSDNAYKLKGSASGIGLSQYKGEVKVEVKAATYAGLKCGRENSKYFCQCIVDI